MIERRTLPAESLQIASDWVVFGERRIVACWRCGRPQLKLRRRNFNKRATSRVGTLGSLGVSVVALKIAPQSRHHITHVRTPWRSCIDDTEWLIQRYRSHLQNMPGIRIPYDPRSLHGLRLRRQELEDSFNLSLHRLHFIITHGPQFRNSIMFRTHFANMMRFFREMMELDARIEDALDQERWFRSLTPVCALDNPELILVRSSWLLTNLLLGRTPTSSTQRLASDLSSTEASRLSDFVGGKEEEEDER